MDQYPGIAFQDGASSRRPALAGRRLDVGQVMQTLRASGNDRAEASAYLGISAPEMAAAVAYYVDHKDAVDESMRDAQAAADEAQAAWERQQQLTQA
ncbi:MAG: hypothetical protein ACRDF8_07360 [Chloroflexota bacterium]